MKRRRIPIRSRSGIVRWSTVDSEDYHKVSAYRWHLSGNKKYAMTSVYVDGIAISLQMSRFISGATGEQQVDHINHRTLDNRRANLRLCSNSQNCMNRRGPIGRHLPTGVSRNTRGYRARVKVMGSIIELGTFATVREALIARKAGEALYYGEFSYRSSKQRVV